MQNRIENCNRRAFPQDRVAALLSVSLTLLFAVSASAQSQQQIVPLEQRIAQQIGQLMLQNATQTIQIEQLTQVLKTTQSRIKELENKYEPKEDK